MKKDYKIRKMMEEDLPICLKMNNTFKAEMSTQTLKSIRFMYSCSGMALVVVGRDDGKIAAFCMTIPPNTPYKDKNYLFFQAQSDYFYLDRIVVHPDHQHQGIGTRLYNHVLSNIGNARLVVDVNIKPYNKPSLDFHHKLGFEDIERVEHSKEYAVVYMEKWAMGKPETKCETCVVTLSGEGVKEHFESEGHRVKESIKKRLYGEGKVVKSVDTKSVQEPANKKVAKSTDAKTVKSTEAKVVKEPVDKKAVGKTKETSVKKSVQGAKVWRAKVAEESKE